MQYLSAFFDECRGLLLQNSGAGDVAGDVWAIAGRVALHWGIAVPGAAPAPNLLWNRKYLDRAMDHYFCGTFDHDVDVERMQQAIARSLPNLLSTAIHNDEVLKELSRTVLSIIQSRLESSRQSIGRTIVETIRCTKDASRF